MGGWHGADGRGEQREPGREPREVVGDDLREGKPTPLLAVGRLAVLRDERRTAAEAAGAWWWSMAK